MRSPKRLIPKLAAAVLPLTGTACSDSPSDNLSSAARDFCLKLDSCYDEAYAEQCIEYYQELAEDVNEQAELSGQCISAIASYLDCLTNLSCEELMDDDSEGVQACDPLLNPCGF